MKRIVPIVLILVLLASSCGTSRFTFDRTEKTITKLGGIYDKEVGEEISRIYKYGGIEDVIETVYQPDYTGGDPYIVVEGYLGEDALDEFTKLVKEKKTEIEALYKGTDLAKDQKGGNEGLALAILENVYPENLVVEALGGEDKNNTQEFKRFLQGKQALQAELRGILDEKSIEGIVDALVNNEYTEEDISLYLGKSILEEAQTMHAKNSGTYGFVAFQKGANVEVLANSKNTEIEEKEELPLITTIVIVVLVLAIIYILAAVIRASYRRPIPYAVSISSVVVVAALGVAIASMIAGWSPFWLGFILAIPSFLILSIDSRN